MSDPTEKPEKTYLDYLDKEMTIMGLLSTFCVAVVALALERVASAKEGGLVAVWELGYRFIVIGSGLMLGVAIIVLVPWCWILSLKNYRDKDHPVRDFLIDHGVIGRKSQETVSKEPAPPITPTQ